MAEKKTYIAYGSNINLEQMAQRCPDAKVIGTAMLENYELEFRQVATVIPSEGARCPVLVWEISEQDEQRLDRYEGYPRLYRKEEYEIELGGRYVKGMAYLMNGGEICPPQLGYYYGILEGYEANGLDTEYLVRAFRNSVIAMSDHETEQGEDTENIMKLE